MTQETQVELGSKVKGQIELSTIDVTPYVGKKVKVESVKEYEGQYGFFIKVITEPAATLDVKNKEEKIVLRGSRIFGLQTNDAGEVGWGEKTKLGAYLKKMKVAHYRDLVGKEVILTSVTNPEDSKDYLSIN